MGIRLHYELFAGNISITVKKEELKVDFPDILKIILFKNKFIEQKGMMKNEENSGIITDNTGDNWIFSPI